MGTPKSGPAAPERNAAQTTGKPFFRQKDETLPQTKNKHKFQIYASSEEFYVAEVWAANEDEAWKIAHDYDACKYHLKSADWQVDNVFLMVADNKRLEPLSPFN